MNWDDGLDAVLRAAHASLSRNAAAKTFTVVLQTVPERDALADLLGLPRRPDGRVTIRLEGPGSLADAVQEAAGVPLSVWLARRFGPLSDPREARRQEQSARDELWSWWRGHPLFCERPEIRHWAAQVERRGVRGGVDERRAVLSQVLAVLAELPSAGEPLPVLAGRVLNDTHALDQGPVAALVLGAVAAGQDCDQPADAAGRRAMWRSVGVWDDELSSTVLVAGLRPVGRSSLAHICQLGAAAGEAVALTLAQTRQHVETWDASVVHVVENPAVLALAIAEFGAGCPPIVCGAGWPTTAVVTLLTSLRESGAELRYHGDFDGDGVRITAHLIDLVGVEPWRMTAADYTGAVHEHGVSVGTVADAAWDDELGQVMRARGVAVLEENVWPVLRGDLAAAITRL